MSRHTMDAIRNIALVGHGAAGKTSLADALLFAARAVERHGSVDDGTSVSDFDEEEHRRHFSIDTSILHAEHAGHELHILDAPGYPDFIGAALEALDAAETAVVVVSAVNGVEVNTRKMFHEAGEMGLGRVIVLNKLDCENVNFPELVALVRAAFGKQCVLFNAPLGVGAKFAGVVSVLNPPAGVPAGCPVDLAAARGQLVEAVVEGDDILTEKYLLEGDVSQAELEAAVPKAIAAGTVVPIFCTAAKKDTGVPELLEALSNYGLTPDCARRRFMRNPAEGDGRPAIEPSESGEFLGQVFKTQNDKFVGHLSYIRVFSGKLKPDQQLVNLRTGKSARVTALFQMQGRAHDNLAEAVAGDIVAVAKVDGLHIGDTVAVAATAPKLPDLRFPTPMFGLAVEPKKRGDEQKIATCLHKMQEEDPTFRVTHDPQTHEMVIAGVSQLHLDVIQHRLKQRFDLEIVTKEPKIPYRETISKKAEADHRHKKQSGGRGQFAEVHLRVYPLSREIRTEQQLVEQFANKDRFEKLRSVHYDPDHNFAFLDHTVGGSVPAQFMPAIEKGCKELIERGALAGYRIQDVAVEVHFGKDHPVDSSEAAFKTAGRLAFKKAVLAAAPSLMEPVVRLEVTVPSKYTGAVLSDLNTKRARVENQDALPGDVAVVTARVPLAEMGKYAAQLNSITQGQGSFAMEFSHYEAVPAHVQQQIVAKANLAHDEDE